MKRDEINDKLPESNSPLDPVASRDVDHPANTRSRTWRNPRRLHPPSPHSQPGPSTAIRQAPEPVGTPCQVRSLAGHAVTYQDASGELQQTRRDDT